MQNVTYINNTVNVTNITVTNNVVYNYGPNYEVPSAHSNRPIQRLNIERQSATNLSVAAKSGALTKVQGNKLVVAVPSKLAKAPPTAKPPTVKTKVAQPRINRGWAGVQNEAELKQKIKTENPQNVPPPTAGAGRAPGGPTPPAAGAAGTPAASPGKPTRAVAPGATPRGITSPLARPRVTPPPRGTPPDRPGTSPAGKVSPAPGAGGRPFERGKPARHRIRDLHPAGVRHRQLLRAPNGSCRPRECNLRRPGTHHLQDPALRQGVGRSAGDWQRARTISARPINPTPHLAAALPTRQTRPRRGRRARRQGLVQPVRMKSALPGKERKVPTLSRAAERPRRLRMVKANHNTGRKKTRGLPRRVRNNYTNLRCSRPLCRGACTETKRRPYLQQLCNLHRVQVLRL